MCLILFKYKSHKKYKLILAANRDEFYKRPTLPLHWWKDQQGILAGRDQEKDGTWMGINKNGRFAAITNFRKMPVTKQFESSRGALVTDFISNDLSEPEYTSKLRDCGDDYDGYNLIFGHVDSLSYFSNRGAEEAEIAPGTYGLSNHLLNTPWPKVQNGRQRIDDVCSEDAVSPDFIFNILRNRDVGEDAQLPDTGLDLELERLLSPSFIKSENYGTRSSTVLMVDWDNNVTLEERSYIPKAMNQYQFKI
ncbi:MAG: NRDE family protein [Flavobacteriales bacterium]|nr:NRDE family protein [Flavobacteriales bacterium]